MAQPGTVDYRGMGPFLPFGVVERLVRDMGTIRMHVDAGVEPLVARWASRRGYHARVEDGTVLLSVAPIEAPQERRRAGREAKPAAAPVAEIELRVDEKNWRSDVSEKLSDVTFIITTVLRAPIVYRGPARGPDFAAAASSSSGVLMRVSVDAQDYFLYVVGGRVLAAASIGRPLTPKQTESILQEMARKQGVLVTLYDASKMF